MFREDDRRRLVRAARCFHSLDGHKTLYAMATLAGLKRLQDAFCEHVAAVRTASEGASAPGIALFWVPAQFRGNFTTSAQVQAACEALEAENPSLKESLTVLWPGAQDQEVAAAWTHLRDLDWRTESLLATKLAFDQYAAENPEAGDEDSEKQEPARSAAAFACLDIVGETYEMLKGELKIRAGSHHGEFFTPETVVWLMVKMTAPRLGQSVLDPCCGSGRMLVLAAFNVLQEHGWMTQETGPDHPLGAGHRLVVPPPMAFVGQDIAPHGPAMGRISLTALGYLNAVFVVRDSLAEPVTMSEAAGIIAGRRDALFALQSRHLVTDESLPTPTPPVHLGLPVGDAEPLAAPVRRSGRAATLDSFG